MIISLLAFIGISASVFAADVPTYPGGDEAMKEFIAKTMIYPVSAKDNGVEGIVNLTFTVNPDGTIGSIKVVRMVDPDLEQEAIRVVKKMPAWIPAEKDGAAIAAPAEVSVAFELE